MAGSHLLVSSLIACPIAVLLHEFGHAAAGKSAGFVVTSLGLGTARPWFVARLGGVRLYLCLVRPLQGITFAFLPQLHPSRLQLVAFTSGGILANGVSAAASLGLWRWEAWGGPFWLASAAINAIIGVMCLLPFSFGVGGAPLRTDGALILKVLRSASLSASPPEVIRTLSALRGLWASVGDTLILRVYLLNAASSWVDLGNPERAEILMKEAEGIPGDTPPSLDALDALVRAEIAIGRGRPAEANLALAAAESYYRSAGQAAGLYLVALLRAGSRPHDGETALALDVLVDDPIATSRPDLGMAALAARCCVACSALDEPAVERHVGEYRASRVRWPSAARDLRVYAALARYLDARGDRDAAETAYRSALAAVAGIANSWSDEEGRSWFLEAQSPLIADARRSFRDEGEADRLLTPVAAAWEQWAERDRKFRRWGLRVMAVNVAAGSVSAGIAAGMGREGGGVFGGLSALMVTFTLLGAVYLLFDVTIGRLAPVLRRFSGTILLTLACYAWLTAAAFYVFVRISP